jgi:hyaluronan synthase
VAGCLVFMVGRGTGLSIYGVGAISLFTVKTVMAWIHRPVRAGPADQARLDALRVGVAVPVYNEDPQMLRECLRSLLAQGRAVQSVALIDDGSSDRRALTEARRWVTRFARRGITLTVHAFPANQGKRKALIKALELQPDADVLLGVDSDTRLDPEAVAEILQPFADDRTKVVTGLVLAHNWNRNLLTRLIDLRYTQAFLVERAAYSVLGGMLCACGSLALYRADIVRRYQADFLSQRFLGQPATFGEDRRLTNYGLLEGRSVLQETAVAFTVVPERMDHFVRQQIRWNKSFFRESVWVLRHLPLRSPAFWLTFVELSSWAIFSIMLMIALVVVPFVDGPGIYVVYFLYVCLLAYARAFPYLELRTIRTDRLTRWSGYIIGPLYGLLHVGVILWLRLFALVTLRHVAWGTRTTVEVEMGQSPRAGRVRPRPEFSAIPVRSAFQAVAVFTLVRVIGVIGLWAGASLDQGDMTARTWLGIKWDSFHYWLIASQGYDDGFQPLEGQEHSNLAFFPLYPWLIRYTMQATHLPYDITALAIVWLSGALAAWAICWLTIRLGDNRYPPQAGVIAAALWAATPFSIVLSKAYTEALFALFAALALVALVERRFVWAGLLCIPAGLTRSAAVALIAAIGLGLLIELVRSRGRDWRVWLGLALTPSGWLAYLAWVSLRVGRWDGWWNIERDDWGRAADPVGALADVVAAMAAGDSLMPWLCAGWLASCVGLLVWSVLREQPAALLVYATVTITVALMATDADHVAVLGRGLLTAFPLLIAPAQALSKAPRPTVAGVTGLATTVSTAAGVYIALVWPYWP